MRLSGDDVPTDSGRPLPDLGADWGEDDRPGLRSYRARRRHVARYIVPVVFLGLMIALVAIVLKSGVLEPATATSPSPVASTSTSASPRTSASPVLYKVKRGDTLSQIAADHGTTVDAILRLNPDLTVNNLTVNARIKLPPLE